MFYLGMSIGIQLFECRKSFIPKLQVWKLFLDFGENLDLDPMHICAMRIRIMDNYSTY